MRARVNPASPFARKVRIASRELGLSGRLQEIDTSVSPVAPNEALAAVNPLVKIPALELDDGTTLYDSTVICEYLDSIGGAKLVPASGMPRWNALRLQSLCDGILDAAVLTRYEMAVRPQAMRWDDWITGQRRKIEGGLAALEAEQPRWGNDFAIGQIGAACVLGYLDFRFPDLGWRGKHRGLEHWFEPVCARPSMRETMPPA